MDGGDEDDRRLLEARMLAHHRRELKPVEIRHADVDQHDRDVVFQQELEGLPGGSGLDQVLAELLQDDLIGQQLCRLIIHQEDVDPVICGHGLASVQRWSHIRREDRSCSVLTGLAR
jgi:hypothetical protein